MEEKNEQIVEEIVESNQQDPGDENVVKETPKTEEKPKENVTKVDLGKFKSQEVKSDVYKVDLSKPPKPEENETKEDNADDSGVVAEPENADAPQEQEKVQPEAETQETPAVEEITEKKVKDEVEKIADKAEQAIAESKETGQPLPENIQKLIDFMNDTGGDLVDYVKLTQDYSKLDDKSLLREYYKATKSHLDDDEINFLMEDNFSYDEEVDDEKDIRRKKLALKEQVASAKSHLDGLKSKYYQEIKSGSRLTPEQQKAVEFFNRYKKTTEETQKQSEALAANFNNRTNKFFGDKFKGFEYNVGDKRFRFNINDANKVKETHGNVNEFMGRFLDENGALKDAEGYHKSLYTAMNADSIAKHFYEQGKADAMKDSVAKSKNVSMDPRQSHGETKNTSGPTFKVLGDNSASFKWKIKNKN